jgi:hypothetical protein
MKKLLMGLALVVAVTAWTTDARAHDAYDDSQSHPLRLLAYAIHPVGFGLEWILTRPIHFVVSTPGLERIFGHTAHENPFGDYQAYDIEAN